MAAMFMIPKGIRSAINGHDDLQHHQPCATPPNSAPGNCPSGVEFGLSFFSGQLARARDFAELNW